MYNNRAKLIETLRKQLSTFEPFRKRVTFFETMFDKYIFYLFIPMGLIIPGIYFFPPQILMTITIISFSLFLFGTAFSSICLDIESVEKRMNKITRELYTTLTQATLQESRFSLYSNIPSEIFDNSNLFNGYKYYFEGYHISGILNNEQIRIDRLQPRKKEDDNYYEGLLLSGTYKNPFPDDLYLFDSKSNPIAKNYAYRGIRSRAGEPYPVKTMLSTQLLKNSQNGDWGQQVVSDTFTYYSPSPNIKKLLTDKYRYLQEFRKIRLLFPQYDIAIACRKNQFYMIINYLVLIEPLNRTNCDLTKTETIERITKNYFHVLEAADILTRLR